MQLKQRVKQILEEQKQKEKASSFLEETKEPFILPAPSSSRHLPYSLLPRSQPLPFEFDNNVLWKARQRDSKILSCNFSLP